MRIQTHAKGSLISITEVGECKLNSKCQKSELGNGGERQYFTAREEQV